MFPTAVILLPAVKLPPLIDNAPPLDTLPVTLTVADDAIVISDDVLKLPLNVIDPPVIPNVPPLLKLVPFTVTLLKLVFPPATIALPAVKLPPLIVNVPVVVNPDVKVNVLLVKFSVPVFHCFPLNVVLDPTVADVEVTILFTAANVAPLVTDNVGTDKSYTFNTPVPGIVN